MWLLWVGVALIILKVLEISVFATLSWWWITLPFVLALIWFEVFEQRLGLDKKKAFDEMEAHKKKRIKDALEANRSRRSR
jgi:small Trp-rich protein